MRIHEIVLYIHVEIERGQLQLKISHIICTITNEMTI